MIDFSNQFTDASAIPANSISVSVSTESKSLITKAHQLAQQLNVPFTSTIEQSQTTLVLIYTDTGLKLQNISENIKKPQTLLYVNFTSGKIGYRFAHEKSIKQPLAKAAGLKRGFRPSIFDATAGLGVDGFVLASLGCHVTMCERSPVIGALLMDGLARAQQHIFTKNIVTKQITFLNENSISYIENTKSKYQCIYLDPMYPHSNQSALNSLTMRTIRKMVGNDQDSAKLLSLSLTKAINRVVVKRPRSAPFIGECTPSHQIKMKNSRFDVYMTFNE